MLYPVIGYNIVLQVYLPTRPTVTLDGRAKQQLAALIKGVKVVGEGTETVEAALAHNRPVKVGGRILIH